MKRALVSVSDKTGLVEFVSGLIEQGYEIISTGGTMKTLVEAGLAVKSISDITEFPEMLDGRVKTLHPRVHGGLLARRDLPEHMAQLEEHGIGLIDLVCVNLYPFKKTVESGADFATVIENIDIGGPSMLRSAAKNFASVTVVCDPADYNRVLRGDYSKKDLAAKVFRHTAQYDALIAAYLTEETYPDQLTLTFNKVQDLRYGENPHQSAAYYEAMKAGYALSQAKQLHGKELSYNNIQDANAAIDLLKEFKQPCVVALKHMNPCGVGLADTIDEAWIKAYEADPVSIFGGIVAFNRPVNETIAQALSQIFLEIVIAPDFDQAALTLLTKKKNIRLLKLDVTQEVYDQVKVVSVNDGLLVQSRDVVDEYDLKVVTKVQPSPEQLKGLLDAYRVVKHVKSNAIVLFKDGQTVGVGAGQMNRVGAANIAIEQAQEKAKGSLLASDAFFPMSDTVEAAVAAGVVAIIQPGGSIKDQDSIDACDQAGIAMVMTGIRHFKH